jgi:secreted trypsin-like serine protease
MRTRLLGTAAAAAALVATTSTAYAVTFGSPDGDDHPAVGALVADQAFSDGTWTYCSGSLVAPQVFLTAAHCGEGGSDQVRVTFSSAYHEGDPVYSGTFTADPAYGGSASDPHDIAVVVLDQPVSGIDPVRLPAAGSLSGLAHGTPITAVGYGAYEVTSGKGGGHRYLYDDVRQEGTGALDSVTKSWLRISENPATGDAGGCFGDSGGPNFLAGTDIEAATTITGDAVCRSTNTAYRLDTASARAFLGHYVDLP